MNEFLIEKIWSLQEELTNEGMASQDIIEGVLDLVEVNTQADLYKLPSRQLDSILRVLEGAKDMVDAIKSTREMGPRGF